MRIQKPVRQEKPAAPHNPRGRLWMLVGIFLFASFGVLIRAFHLQMSDHNQLQRLADSQHDRTIKFSADRGSIYDRNHVQLAVSLGMQSAFVNPKQIENPRPAARKLAQLFHEPESGFYKALTADRYFSWIKRQISPKEAEQVKEIIPEGFGSVEEKRRFYPQRMLASHLLGFVGAEGNGLDGLELKFEGMLKGATRTMRLRRDAHGRAIDLQGELLDAKTLAGNSLVLTLDRNIQHIVERELEHVAVSTKAKSGSVVVMDPQSGEILAMANWPPFDPNVFSLADQESRRNRAIVDVFEPGSSLKVFVMAKAIEKGLVKPNEIIFCENGLYRVKGGSIRDVHPNGNLTPAEIIKHSSNIGMYKIAQRFKPKDLYETLQAFGFGEKTGLPLLGESRGLVRSYQDWHGVTQGNIGFGQGLAVTTLQLTRAMASVANGGKILRPRIIKDIQDPAGKSFGLKDQAIVMRQSSSPKALKEVAQMMVGVTEEGGTGVLAQVPGFTVAGKTGTSQKVDPKTGSYSPDRYVSSFAGFVPAEAPRLVIVVVVDEPEGQAYGGMVAAPVFRRIAEQSLLYLGVKPRTPVLARAEMFKPAADKQTKGLLWAAVRDVERELTPTFNPGDIQSTGGLRMPDLKGMTLRDALQELQRENLSVKVEGSGIVTEQRPREGDTVNPRQDIVIRARPFSAIDGEKPSAVELASGKRI